MWRRLLLLVALVDLCVSFAPLPDDESGCLGHTFDLARLRTVSNARSEHFGGSKSYRVRLTSATENGGHCRVRLAEVTNGVPIYGAETVVTLTACPSAESEVTENLEHGGLGRLALQDVTGKTFESVQVARGYEAAFSADAVKQFLTEKFPIDDHESLTAMEDPELYIFAAQAGDYLAYFSEVLVKEAGSFPKVIRVIVDAHDLSILRTCNLSSAPSESRMRKLRQYEAATRDRKQLFSENLCSTCATVQSISSISATTTTQQINSLYLNDAGRNAIVSVATLSAGGTINIPGAVSSLYWQGTYHCFSGTGTCRSVGLPTSCPDALSDVQYVGVETLKYASGVLKVLGGLSKSASSAVAVSAFTHYDSNYCNAFFLINQVVFGDCDCSKWSPLVTVDIVAHELAHGFTRFSSRLEYQGQSGGLNEGYSDVLGTVMEYYLMDSVDTPDFLVGERLQGSRGPLRYMENPPQDGRSIGDVCAFTSDLNVHFSSGVLNKAFVNAANACAADACSSSQRECVLLIGNLFFYTNLNRLSIFSNYLDAARETCSAVTGFVSEIASPATACTAGHLTSFTVAGWSAVGVSIDPSTCASSNSCPLTPSPTVATFPTQTPTECSCFSRHASVPVKDKGPTEISLLDVGDMALTANGYSELYAFGHQADETMTEFLQIYTEKQHDNPLEITSQHMLFVVGKSHAVPAHTIRPGDLLQSSQWTDGMLVVHIDHAYRNGLYAPLTADGTIVVDGVVSSCYVALQGHSGEYVLMKGGISTGFSQHFAAHLSMAPVRMACMGISTHLCNSYGEDGLAYFVKYGYAAAEWADSLSLPTQVILLPIYVLGMGSLYALELVFGPKLALLLVLALAAACVTACAKRIEGRGKRKVVQASPRQ